MEPVRTCVGCKKQDSRSSLSRIVNDKGSLKLDLRGALPGRGAWLHPTSDCLAKALDRKAIGRALRASTLLDPADLIAHIEQVETMLAKNE